MRSGFFGAKRFLFVIPDPDSAGHCGRKTNEPGVSEIVCSAGFSGHGEWQLRRGNARAVKNDLPQLRTLDLSLVIVGVRLLG